MYKLLLFITTLFLFNTNVFSQPSSSNKVDKAIWVSDYDEALALSKKENKPLLIYFTGSDWCIYCKRLKKDFLNSEEFKNRVDDDIILYEANFPRNKSLVNANQKADNYYLKRKFKVNVYPTLVVINSKQQEINRQTGYNLKQNTQIHYKFIDKILVK
ncbi:MAG TPA: thioredoxin family protein [Flavobacteriaceae bacterium]|nr:thioredoxin family protein [Flavobacteriaceae bacterium]